MQSYNVVEVEWLDAQSGFGQAVYVEDLIDEKPIHTLSVGYLLHECDEYVVLGFMLFGNDMVKHNQLIPKGMIKRISTLRLGCIR